MTIESYINYIRENNKYYLAQKTSKKKKIILNKNVNNNKLPSEPVIISNKDLARIVCNLNPDLKIKINTLYNSSIQILIPEFAKQLKLPTNLYIKNNKIYDKNSNFLVHIQMEQLD